MKKFGEGTETGCCKRFNPTPWEGKLVRFKNRLFLKDKVLCAFNIPLNLGRVIVRALKLIENAGALGDQLMLYNPTSLFSADVRIAVRKNVPGARMESISGEFLSKVFEGSYGEAGKWTAQMNEFASKRGKKIKKLYFYYPTCPACAKHYGKNYTVLLAQV